MLQQIISIALECIKNVKTEHIALFSVLVTVLVFIMNRRSELRYKKQEDRKKEYVKFMEMLESVHNAKKDKKTGEIFLDEKLKNQFFDVGSSLLVYGSKKLYKQYIFYREYTTNPMFKISNYYDENISIYIIAKMLVTIRKEVGLSAFSNISQNEALAFFVNAIAHDPLNKIKMMKANYKLKMIKAEMFMIDRIYFIYTRRLFNFFVRPVWGVLLIIN